MNIETVANNLRNTIAGKEALLTISSANMDSDVDIVDREICEFLKINIAELQRVLQDVEQCVKKESDDSWITNPDRMGGCFTEDELNESGWK